MLTRRVIAYRRVSTSMQFDSGAGLEGQKKIIEDFCVKNGFFLLDTYTEALSGKDENRPELMKCIESCQKQGANLIVAKLDRLSRRVSFISSFKEIYGIEFVVANLGLNYNKTLIYFLSIMAEYEREAISQRVKAGIAQKKAEGTYRKPPGNKELWKGGKGNAKYRENAEAFRLMIYRELDFIFEGISEDEPVPTLEKLAELLNSRGNRTYKKRNWTKLNLGNLFNSHRDEMEGYEFYKRLEEGRRKKWEDDSCLKVLEEIRRKEEPEEDSEQDGKEEKEEEEKEEEEEEEDG